MSGLGLGLGLGLGAHRKIGGGDALMNAYIAKVTNAAQSGGAGSVVDAANLRTRIDYLTTQGLLSNTLIYLTRYGGFRVTDTRINKAYNVIGTKDFFQSSESLQPVLSGGEMRFTDDILVSAESFAASAPLALSMWINSTSITKNQTVFRIDSTAVHNRMHCSYALNDNKIGAYVQYMGNNYILDLYDSPTINQWHHIIWEFNGTQVRAILNKVAGSWFDADLATISNICSIGGSSSPISSIDDAMLDEIVLINASMTTDIINALYALRGL